MIQPSRPRVSPTLLTALLAIAACTGCARNEFAQRLARFEPGEPDLPAVTVPAPEDGLYKVRWAADPAAPPGALATVPGTRRQLRKGEPVGFHTDADGRVVAVAGRERIPLPDVPEDAGYLIWHHTRAEKSVEVGDVGRTIGQAALTAGGLAAVAALEVATAALNQDDDCDDADAPRRHREHKHHASKKPVTVP